MMMTVLSVNLNKVALVRNARATNAPDLSAAAAMCLAAGAGGITVHPRPNERHTRHTDVLELADLVRASPGIEFNVEGNPFPAFLTLIHRAQPTQCTLVPDAPGALTSDHGWDLAAEGARLRPIIQDLVERGVRVSLFLDPVPEQISRAADLGVHRVELYTESYARSFGTPAVDEELERFAQAAEIAQGYGLGVNAGHDLSLTNLGAFLERVPGVLEVSIGHALVSHALEVGLARSVRDFLDVIGAARPQYV